MGAADKAPAFQFYPKDWQSDERVKLMTYEQRGLYIDLLCHCWLEGSLPADVSAIGRIVHQSPARFTRMWNGPLGQCFYLRDDGRWSQKRLDAEREKQERFRRRQSDAAASKWHSRSDAVGLPSLCPREGDEEEDSSSSGKETNARALADRASQLREVLYPQWYAKFRHGARLRLIANPLEFQEAQSLVATWDDATLEKLAAIVLTTDDPWISGTDRSFRIFAMKASWAHDRLAQWERAHGVAS